MGVLSVYNNIAIAAAAAGAPTVWRGGANVDIDVPNHGRPAPHGRVL
jgi:hypothetical protein